MWMDLPSSLPRDYFLVLNQNFLKQFVKSFLEIQVHKTLHKCSAVPSQICTSHEFRKRHTKFPHITLLTYFVIPFLISLLFFLLIVWNRRLKIDSFLNSLQTPLKTSFASVVFQLCSSKSNSNDSSDAQLNN